MDGVLLFWPRNFDFVFSRMGFPDGFEASSGCSRFSGMSLFFSKRYSFKNSVQCHDCYHPFCFLIMFISFLSGWMSNAQAHPPMWKILPMRFEPVRVKAYPLLPISTGLSDISSPLILKNPGSRSTPHLPRKEPGLPEHKRRKFP